MENRELKPCPFCGGVAELYRCRLYLDDAIRVICRGCGVATQKVLVDHLRYSGGAYGYLESDVDHTIYELKKKYAESEGTE